MASEKKVISVYKANETFSSNRTRFKRGTENQNAHFVFPPPLSPSKQNYFWCVISFVMRVLFSVCSNEYREMLWKVGRGNFKEVFMESILRIQIGWYSDVVH